MLIQLRTALDTLDHYECFWIQYCMYDAMFGGFCPADWGRAFSKMLQEGGVTLRWLFGGAAGVGVTLG